MIAYVPDVVPMTAEKGDPILAVLILAFLVYLMVLAATHARGIPVTWRFAFVLAMVIGGTAGAVTACGIAALR